MYLACTRRKTLPVPGNIYLLLRVSKPLQHTLIYMLKLFIVHVNVLVIDQHQENMAKVTPMKRKNFSAEEITFLKSLIQKYRPNQIENKKTDTANLGEKQRIWESITAEFNAHFQNGEEVCFSNSRMIPSLPCVSVC